MKLKQERSGISPLLLFQRVILVQNAFILLLICITLSTDAQKQDYIWCFGDSAGLDFNSGIPLPFQSGIQTHEAAASMSDDNGNLLFYIGDKNQVSNYSKVLNSNHQMMFNGDSIFLNGSTTNGVIIIPYPGFLNRYYIFNLNSFNGFLTYSIVDLTLQGGLGEVTQKNIIIGNEQLTERIAAIKHGNGRDWWIITHPYNNEYNIYFISPMGIIGPAVQIFGINYQNFNTLIGIGEISVSTEGDKIAAATGVGIIEIFNFDRCSGTLSSWNNVGPLNPILPQDQYYGCEFSPNGNLLYVTIGVPPFSKLIQINLQQPVGLPIIYDDNNDSISFGQLQRGPDGKIYMANVYNWSFPNNSFDSLNTYIGVINDPDSTGIACNFAPYSVYLGGRRSFYSLPNMPNYNLGAFAGSPCDTLTSIHTISETKQAFEIIPNPVSSDFIISLSGNPYSENYYELKIFNSEGQLVFKDRKYNVDDKINFETFSSGLYAITLTRNGRQWYSKFIKL